MKETHKMSAYSIKIVPLVSACILCILQAPGPAAEPQDKRQRFFTDVYNVIEKESGPHEKATCLIRLAIEYKKAGYSETASDLITKALSAYRDDPWAASHLKRLASQLLKAKMFAQAERVIESITDHSSKASALAELAKFHALAGHHTDSIKIIARTFNEWEDTEGYHKRRNTLSEIRRALRQLGKSSETRDIFLRLIDASSKLDKSRSGTILSDIGQTAFRSGFPELAERALSYISDQQQRTRAFINIAQTAADSGQRERARQQLQLAMENATKCGSTQTTVFLLTSVAQKASDIGFRALAEKAARKASKAAEKAQGSRLESYTGFARAKAWLSAGRPDVALEETNKMTESSFKNIALNRIAAYYAEKGQHEKALALIEKFSSDNKNAFALNTICEGLAKIGEYERAKALLKRIDNPQTQQQTAIQAAKQAIARSDVEDAISFSGVFKKRQDRDRALAATLTDALENLSPQNVKALSRIEKLADSIKAKSRRNKVFLALAENYLKNGMGQKAEQLAISLAHAEFDTLPDYVNAGKILARVGRREAARKKFHLALRKARGIGCGTCRSKNLANIYEAMVESEMGQEAYTQFQDLASASQLIHSYLRSAEKALKNGEMERGREIALKALRSCVDLPDTQQIVETVLQIGEVYENHDLSWSGSESKAIKKLEQTIKSRQVYEGSQVAREGVAYLLYFHQPGCPECKDVSELLKKMEDRFELRVKKMDLMKRHALELNKGLCEKLDLPGRQHGMAPSIFASNGALVGRNITTGALTRLIRKASGKVPPWKYESALTLRGKAALHDKSVPLSLVLIAGLGDGFNPCAFAVIVFFATYMAFVGHSRREIALAGIVYTAAVFLTYLTIGLALHLLARQIQAPPITRTIFHIAMIVLLTLAAGLSLKDGIQCKRGETDKVTLKLPDNIKTKIHQLMTHRVREGLTITSALVLGALVGVLELPCTGQTYITIIYKLPESFGTAFLKLLLYNLCFILPLVGVFLFVLFGATSQQVSSFFQKHLAKTKFGLAGVFLMLAIYLVWTLP
ncbi:MAG: hypothetical protein ACLFWL_03245 [Candidatus Brocadiia bacterium]